MAPIIMPIVVAVFLYRWSGWTLAIVYVITSWWVGRRISKWRYGVVFDQYLMLAVTDWRKKGNELTAQDLIRMEEETAYMLSMNLKE